MQKDYEKILNFIYAQEELPRSLREKLDAWLLAHENDEEVLEGMYNLWEDEINRGNRSFNPESLSRILEEVSAESICVSANRIEESPKWRSWWRYAAVVGAIVVSVLSTVIISNYLHPEMMVLATADGSRGDFRLPDGTEVTLNGGSRLSYDAKGFGKRGKRKVSVEGEAFFDVAKDKMHPFEVKLTGSSVEVTGTRFEVRNYPYSNYEEVVLESGSVNVSGFDGDKTVRLHPDQRFIKSRDSKKWVVEDTEASKYCRWIQRRLKLENEPLGDLLITIERKYGVDVNVSPDVDLDETLTITLQNDELDEILSVISYLTGIKYDLKGHNLLISANK